MGRETEVLRQRTCLLGREGGSLHPAGAMTASFWKSSKKGKAYPTRQSPHHLVRFQGKAAQSARVGKGY